MSEPPTIEDHPVAPIPPPRPSRRGPVIAWVLILLTVGYMLLATILPNIRGRTPQGQDPSDPQMALVVKYVLGLRSITNFSADSLILQIDAMAKSPMQKLHAAVFAGSFKGADIAIERLDALEADSPQLQPDIDDFRAIYVHGSDAMDPENRSRLADRHGIFARLALLHDKPPSDPMRKSLADESLFAARAVIAFGVVVVLSALAGFVLLIIAIIMYFDGSLRPAYKPRVGNAGICVEMFAVYLVGFSLLSAGLGLIMRGSISLGWYWLLSIIVPITFSWGMWRGLSWTEIRQAIGWNGGRGPLIEVTLGVVGYLAGLPVVAAGIGIMFLLNGVTGTTPTHPVQGAETDSLISILLLYSIACIWAPVIEETMFEALYSHLRARFGWVISGLIVGVIFAAIHPQGWTVIPALASIGFVLAAIREWRGSILASMAAHALSNFAVITLLVAVK